MPTYFVSAIDTDAGKTIATGLIAKYLQDQGKNAITCKLVQTGCEKIADDIVSHRKSMDTPLLAEDHDGRTCPYVFAFPASPHLSAQLEGCQIEKDKLIACIRELEAKYDYVIVEGAGGLQVPLQLDYTALDFIEEFDFDILLVTYPRLGSINHTLLSLECLQRRNINLVGTIYNNFPIADATINEESKRVIAHYTKRFFADAHFWEIPELKPNITNKVSFEGLI